MGSSWRARKPNVKSTVVAAPKTVKEIPIPAHFRCPISLDLMRDPVTVSTGITYDRHSIETWVEMGNSTCPVTNQEMAAAGIGGVDVVPNHTLRKMIQDWCVANSSRGVERIPTPKIPVTPPQATDMLSEIAEAASSAGRGDEDAAARCRRLVSKVKDLVRESDRNRRCFASSGANRVLASSFSALFADHGAFVSGVSQDILSIIPSMFPLDEDSVRLLASPHSLSSIIGVMKHGCLAGRLSAVLVVKELLSFGGEQAAAISRAEGLVHELVKLIKDPLSPQTTKASLIAIYYMISADVGRDGATIEFVDAGLVRLLLEALVDADRSLCEKALAVLDGLLGCELGRRAARGHALAAPVLVKKMFRVSAVATELVVSTLWRLCSDRREGDGGEAGREVCMVEALQVGAFQKLLLLLQVGCSEAAKDKATELLRLLNGHRGRAECIDTMDFKGLNRAS